MTLAAKTLITGATGFIGKHIAIALTKRGTKLKCLVRKTSQTNFLEQLGTELSYGDMNDTISLKKALQDVDTIYHAAGEVFATQEKNYYNVNVAGLKNLLEACSHSSVKKLVHFSSSSATGPNPQKNIPVTEESPCHPITPYGMSKLEGEKTIQQLSEQYHVPIVIIRPPLVYGPGVSQSSRVLMFLKLINRGLFRIIGDGNNLVSLCYIDNLIHGILLAAEEKRAEGQIYFISDSSPYTINEIAKTIAEEQGKPTPSSHIPLWAAAPLSMGLGVLSNLFGFNSPLTRNTVKELKNSWFVDITKAQKDLGYQPHVEFRDGVRKTVEWFYNEYLPAI
jgi:nucleoside-diphosphate-sugar epimerase